MVMESSPHTVYKCYSEHGQGWKKIESRASQIEQGGAICQKKKEKSIRLQ